MANASNLVIWQWNCFSFPKRKAALQQFIQYSANRPAVILLQETADPALRAYRAKADHRTGTRGIATLIFKKYAYVRHEVRPDLKDEHIMIELIPNSKLKQSVFILNVYSTPKNTQTTFQVLFQRASKIVGDHMLIIAGDLNSTHPDFGYRGSSRKGAPLSQMHTHRLTLLTDPTSATWVGNSVTRDSAPDLTMVRHAAQPTWTNLGENLGSDHYIIQTIVNVSTNKIRQFRITDWDHF